MEIINEEDFDVTFSGGDPLYHPLFIAELAKRIVATGHDVWLYTGFTWEEIIRSPQMLSAIENVSVIVDSPFIESLRDPDLPFRGSSNQRIIDVAKSVATAEIVLKA